jgi:signal peptidase II
MVMVKKNKFSLFFLIIILIVCLDQLTKYIFKNFFNYSMNSGSLFGILQGSASILAWFSLVIIGGFLFYYEKIKSMGRLAEIGSGLVVGGAIGNLIDRVLFKSVIDFINVGWWPSFNIADSAISIGIVLLIWFIWNEEN